MKCFTIKLNFYSRADSPSFFEGPPPCIDLPPNNVTYCICEKNPSPDIGADDRARCKQEVTAPLKKSSYTCDNLNQRRKRAISDDGVMNDDHIDDEDLFSTIVPEEGIIQGPMDWDIPADRQLSEALAMQTCTDALENSPVYADCLGHVDMASYVDECITDLYVRTCSIEWYRI